MIHVLIALSLALVIIFVGRWHIRKMVDNKITVFKDKINEDIFPYIGKRGKIAYNVNGNHYLGTVEYNNNIDEMLVYSETPLKKGDWFTVDHIDNGRIFVKKNEDNN